jgi:hypothetical protein
MDSAPLLQNTDGLPSPNVMQDHVSLANTALQQYTALTTMKQPAFLRACHSPWSFIPQNVLVILRGIVLALVTAVGILVLNFEFHEHTEYSKWRIIFDFANLSLFFVFLYELKTFVSFITGLTLCTQLTSTGLDFYPSVLSASS